MRWYFCFVSHFLTKSPLKLRISALRRQHFPPQHLDLALLSADLQMQKRTFVIDQFGDLHHRCLHQHLHDRGELRLKGNTRRHVRTRRDEKLKSCRGCVYFNINFIKKKMPYISTPSYG